MYLFIYLLFLYIQSAFVAMSNVRVGKCSKLTDDIYETCTVM